jgi:hypothetical protein
MLLFEARNALKGKTLGVAGGEGREKDLSVF